MSITHKGRFERADIWREGKWLDLWSVVHLLSGISVGFVLYFLQFGSVASLVLAILIFISYELWEMAVQIKEAPTNRIMDVVVGVASFLPTFFLLAPRLQETSLIIVFGLFFTGNVVMSVFGWIASQKAADLERRVRERYLLNRARRLKRKAQRESEDSQPTIV